MLRQAFPDKIFLLKHNGYSMKAIIGKKLGMTRIFDQKGTVIPVTLVEVGENVITQVKTKDKDGYKSAQLALSEDRKINQPLKGHLAKSKIKSKTIREFDLDGEVGAKIDLTQFQVGDLITVSATSKGKGFAGTVKRHNFSTGPKTHGSNNYRQPGSIGSAYPQHVIKGRKMAGHLGYDKTTVKNLKIAALNLEDKILMIKGAVPGPNKSKIFIWSK